MHVELDQLPVIDWELGLKLAGNNQALAEDILALFVKTLRQDLDIIKQLNKKKNYSALSAEVHKLHGAVSYTGTPRLKALIVQLETDLKNHIMISLPFLLNQLETEVTLLLEHYSRRQS